ncbi:hypothetical protein [Massilia antarctica]|uniref:hypothetical protein n=1 Tax=Massilia antarctica TaxID=2765360 RepID=UPI00227045A4|nr:hypothetical protein [Massilia sp. H27-R4]MCY0912412.1 hypothetical protein [Massilia sp. H27-R4]
MLTLGGCTSPGPSRRDIAAAQAQHDSFTNLCSESAHESIKRFPRIVKQIYLSESSKVYGAYGFELFFGVTRARRWAFAELLDGPAAADRVEAPGAYEVRYTYLPVTSNAAGERLQFHGVRQEIIELSTKEVIAERENYIWGKDFNRSSICIDSSWFSGSDNFVDRVLGGRYRDESSHVNTPEKYTKARILGSVPVDVKLLDVPSQSTLPPGSVFDYNDRKVTLPNGSSFRMPMYGQGEPLPGIATLVDGSDYVFVLLPGGHSRNWPLRQVLLYRRDNAGHPIEKVYVQLPRFVDWSNGWGMRQQDISIENGSVRISVYGMKKRAGEFSDQSNDGRYTMRYDFVAQILK